MIDYYEPKLDLTLLGCGFLGEFSSLRPNSRRGLSHGRQFIIVTRARADVPVAQIMTWGRELAACDAIEPLGRVVKVIRAESV